MTFIIIVSFYGVFALAKKIDCLSIPSKPSFSATYPTSPTGDFAIRDTLPQTEIDVNQWRSCCGSFGPCAQPYPRVVFPSGVDRAAWKRIRVAEAAKKLIDLPYRHHHIPAMGGLDCSNFTSFVYNFALGIRFSSAIERQSEEVGRKLSDDESLVPGDLIFLYAKDFSHVSHVAIYLSPTEVIDSTGPGTQIRPFADRYQTHFAWARRVIE